MLFRSRNLFIALVPLLCSFSWSQEQIQSIAFYNVENLFDPSDDPNTYDEDYTSEGRNRWTKELLDQKINQLATAIHQIGEKETGKAPMIVGLAEVENRSVVEQLISHPLLQPYQYEIVHFDSPDSRGIDVALIYRKSIFILEAAKKYKLFLVDPKTQSRRTTRDQLVVSGYWGETAMAVSVNHWPSRRGGQKRSEASRKAAALLQQRLLDSIQGKNPEMYLVSMGDFNDNPTDTSLEFLTHKSDFRPSFQPMFNPMIKLFKNGIGSLAFRDRWHLFDQILLSNKLAKKRKSLFY